MTASLAIGSTAFIARLRREVLRDTGTQSNSRLWKRLLSFEEVVKSVESAKGEAWNDFRLRRGDSGRDVVLSIVRSSCGLTLREIGGKAGMSHAAVSKAVNRVNRRIDTDRELKDLYESALLKLEETERKR